MKSISYILSLAIVGLCLSQEVAAQQRGRTFDERGRQTDRRLRQDDRRFDPGWWREWPDQGRWQPPGTRPRPSLGVVYRNTSDGVLIASIVPRSPAQRAGLQRGDILVAMDGRRIDSADDARRVLRRRQPGDRMRLIYERRGRVRQTVAELR